MNLDIHDTDHGPGMNCISRRQLLLRGGLTVAVVTLGSLPGLTLAEPAKAVQASYPRRKIGTLSALKKGAPLEFTYPHDDIHNLLVKLGVAAGGGVGAQQDVVAFNQLCTHMGGPLAGTFKDAHQILGPCPLHLTTFDLTRHGMVVSGHGTESLPQIILEVSGDDIFAIGVMGLVYGRSSNITQRRT